MESHACTFSTLTLQELLAPELSDLFEAACAAFGGSSMLGFLHFAGMMCLLCDCLPAVVVALRTTAAAVQFAGTQDTIAVRLLVCRRQCGSP